MKQLVIALLFLLTNLVSFSQLKNLQIYSVEELMNIGSEQGISKLESYTSPINILYVDSTKSKNIIAMEFKIDFVEKHSQSSEHFYLKTPFYTKYLAENFNDKYAVKKLFDFYSTSPKFIKSDTIAYYGHADPLYGDIDPPIGNWIKEFDSMTILPFFS